MCVHTYKIASVCESFSAIANMSVQPCGWCVSHVDHRSVPCAATEANRHLAAELRPNRTSLCTQPVSWRGWQGGSRWSGYLKDTHMETESQSELMGFLVTQHNNHLPDPSQHSVCLIGLSGLCVVVSCLAATVSAIQCSPQSGASDSWVTHIFDRQ